MRCRPSGATIAAITLSKSLTEVPILTVHMPGWRRGAAAIVLLTASALLVGSPAGAVAKKKKRTPCEQIAGDTLYRDGTLRFFRVVRRHKSDADASTLSLRFCKPRSTRRATILRTISSDLDAAITVTRVARAGKDHMAVEYSEQTGTDDAVILKIYNLQTRVRTFEFSQDGSDGFEWVVTRQAGAAVIDGAGNARGFDGSGEHPLGVGASALASAGDVVYWTQGGLAMSATLTGAAKSAPGD